MNVLKESLHTLYESFRILSIIVFFGIKTPLQLLFTNKKDYEKIKGRALRDFILNMGPIYIKAGQVIATQSGLLSKEANDQLKILFANTRPSKPAYITRLLNQSYGGKTDTVFHSFDKTPIAVGSVAQVHLGVLQEGRRVAVKIVKAGVERKIRSGVQLIRGVLYILHRLIPRLRAMDMPGHFDEIREMLLDQCNMKIELANQEAVAKNFQNHPYLKIPKTFEQYSNEQILVMEYVSGISGEEVDQITYSRAQLAKRLQDSFYTMAYFHGLYHLDPHPGNVLFQNDGTIYLLDFGLVGRLSVEDKWMLSAFFYACIRGEWDLAIQRLVNTFIVNKAVLKKDWEHYVNDQKEVLQKHFVQQKNKWSTLGFFDDTNRLLQKYKSRVTTRFSQFGIAFLTGEGFISRVDPTIDIWENARKFADRSSPYVSEKVRAKFDHFFNEFIPNSMKYRKRVASYLVAPTHLDRYVLPSTYPLIVEKAEGCHLTDIDGNEYIDLSCGYGPHILGYAHPHLGKAIDQGCAQGNVNAMGNVAEFKFAEQLVKAFPHDDNKVILCNSGTEAVLMAFRLCRVFRGKKKVAKFEGHYHGFSDQGMVSSWFQFRGSRSRPVAVEGCPGSMEGVVENTLVLQYGQASSLLALEQFHEELACVICEPMPSSLGYFDRPFLLQLRYFCDVHQIPLIFDEVVSGFRTTYGGIQHLIGVYPDLTCLGKIIGGGLPCGAVVGKKNIIELGKTSEDPFKDLESKTFVGGTLSGNALTASAGYAMLNYLDNHREVYEELQEKTIWLTDRLREVAISKSIPNHIVGNYSIFTITFNQNKPELYRDRIYATNSKANMALSYYIRKHHIYMPELHTMMLSTAHTYDDLTKVVDAFDQCLDEMIADQLFLAQ